MFDVLRNRVQSVARGLEIRHGLSSEEGLRETLLWLASIDDRIAERLNPIINSQEDFSDVLVHVQAIFGEREHPRLSVDRLLFSAQLVAFVAEYQLAFNKVS